MIFLRLHPETRWYWGKIFHILCFSGSKEVAEERVLVRLSKALSLF